MIFEDRNIHAIYKNTYEYQAIVNLLCVRCNINNQLVAHNAYSFHYT